MNTQKKTWHISGMHCPHCEKAILRAVKDLDGLSSPNADYRAGTLTAQWEESRLPEGKLAERIAQAGYELKSENKSPLQKALTLLFAALALAALYLLFALTPLKGLLSAFPTARTGMSLGALFVVGMLTSLHCVAMCGGINLAQSAASAVPAAIRLSRATLRNIHENLFWAFIYNVIGIPLAAGVFIPIFGWTLNPMFGAAAMSLSSFCVVSNALRLNFVRLRGKERKQAVKPLLQVKTVSAAQTPRVQMELTIDGMMCEHCEARVKKVLESIPGVINAEADHQAGKATVQAEQVIDEELLRLAVEAEDYHVTGILSF